DDIPQANSTNTLLYRVSNQFLSFRSNATKVDADFNTAACDGPHQVAMKFAHGCLSFLAANTLRPLTRISKLLESHEAYVNINLVNINVQLGQCQERSMRDAAVREMEVEKIEQEIASLTGHLEQLRRMQK
ncbi:hypothetical protein PENTCL1PPCAC_18840, partial [Pristionchus entomophagus]